MRTGEIEMRVKIKKATGQIEDFDESKLLNSLIRAGAATGQAEDRSLSINYQYCCMYHNMVHYIYCENITRSH